jgi:hypothetical protein
LRGGDFVLADPEDGRLRVDADHLRLEGLTLGEMVTVIGRLDDGKLEAGHVIREDGSVVVRGASHDEDEEERS